MEGNVFVVDIRQEGIIRLTTIDSKGHIYNYLLTSGQIIKFREFENGTK